MLHEGFSRRQATSEWDNLPKRTEPSRTTSRVHATHIFNVSSVLASGAASHGEKNHQTKPTSIDRKHGTRPPAESSVFSLQGSLDLPQVWKEMEKNQHLDVSDLSPHGFNSPRDITKGARFANV